MLEIIGLSKSYGKIKAAVDINIRLQGGQILGLIGPNGSGKTTTIRSALTLLDWDVGKVRINGHDIIDDPVEARKGLGYIPDDPEMYNGLTVWQHIAFVARAHRATGWESRAEDMLRRFELVDKRDELVGTLSKGQTQKCWCACVFVPKPMVVLMDEPITGMDPRGVHVFKELVAELRERGGCGLISSHQLPLVEDICDRIALISKGRIVIEGGLDELKEQLKLSKDRDLEDLYLKITEMYKADGG
jgi:ABC-2 type transport system ATP-binding protein